MTISYKKSKVMAFIGHEPVRCKIIINDKIFEKVNEFKYLRCLISYKGERDVKNKISISMFENQTKCKNHPE
jgi:hypothetical protein